LWLKAYLQCYFSNYYLYFFFVSERFLEVTKVRLRDVLGEVTCDWVTKGKLSKVRLDKAEFSKTLSDELYR